ncbi:MAG: tetratricopeptide repeat protein [Pseudobdellovibrionaceae bacterium]
MSKSKLLTVAIFLSLIFLLPLSSKAESSSAELFAEGTKSYSSKDYSKALDFFEKALDKDPYNAATITNLALTQFQLGKKSVAVGLLRKALSVEPDLTTAKAGLKFVLSQMPVKDVPHKIENYESLRTTILQPVPLITFVILSILCLFASGWILISYGGRRKKAFAEEKPLPSFPFIGSLLGFFFIIITILLILKIYDSISIRGTIVEDQISLQTAPGDNQVTILDLYGGMEVIVLETQGEWAQIKYPGSLTGWVKKSALLMTH